MKRKEYVLAAVSIVLWGSSASVGALLLESLDTLPVLFYSGLVATIFLLAVNAATGRLKALRTLRGREVLAMIGVGLMGTFVYNGLFYLGLPRLKAQQAFIINYLWPILIVVFSCLLLRRAMTARKGVALVLSFLGVAIVATEGNFTDLGGIDGLGVLFCMGAAVCYALFSVLNLFIRCDKFVAMMIYYATTLVSGLIGCLLTGGVPSLSLPQWGGLVWNGALVQGLAYTTWAMAMDAGDTAKISNLAYLTPFVSLIYIFFLLGEPIVPSSFVGLAFILLGVAVQMGKRSKAAEA